MVLIEAFGYFFSVLIGIILGLIGGGGSILAVPIFTYLFMIDEKLATGYSLFVVGCSAMVGSFKQHQKGTVDFRIALIFGLPAILSVTAVRLFLIPIIPEELFAIGDVVISRRMGILGLFAVVMISAALSMLKRPKKNIEKRNLKLVAFNYPLILIVGILIGSITGLVGAGGGFLIIPALVLFANIDIKTAIGTSLTIVTLKSLIGFLLGDALVVNIDWRFLLPFTCLAVFGVFIGNYLGSYFDNSKLRKIFGYFIFVMAGFIIYMEFIDPSGIFKITIKQK
ncbi:MAG: hypothetical protein CMB96_05655 [Flavobacteriaceae bacterium]|nr:hypothetical protein [Flavobacteriaceae bacterium]